MIAAFGLDQGGERAHMAAGQATELRLGNGHLREGDRLEYWRDTVTGVLSRAEIVHTDTRDLTCEIHARRAGGLVFLDSHSSPFAASRIERHIRADDRNDLMVGLLLSGSGTVEQDDRRMLRRPGSFVVTDMARPYASTTGTDHQAFGFALPRDRLERAFGTAKRFTLLPIDETLGSGAIIAYLTSMFRSIDIVGPERAAEMAEIGVELVIGALARRLAKEPALSQGAGLQLYRAKTHIAAHIGDTALCPQQVAVALGISLRHLQALFQRQQISPADWIWTKRLSVARDRLAAPGYAGLSVSEIAFACGFSDQAHFSRRFKAAFGLSPRDWRNSALIASTVDA